MIDLPKTVAELLVAEHGKTPEEAASLVKKHTQIVMNAIMGGLTMSSVRACAMAIEMVEDKGTTP